MSPTRTTVCQGTYGAVRGYIYNGVRGAAEGARIRGEGSRSKGQSGDGSRGMGTGVQLDREEV